MLPQPRKPTVSPYSTDYGTTIHTVDSTINSQLSVKHSLKVASIYLELMMPRRNGERKQALRFLSMITLLQGVSFVSRCWGVVGPRMYSTPTFRRVAPKTV